MYAHVSSLVHTVLYSALLLVLAGCGEDASPTKDPFVGRFSTNFQGAPVRLTLTRSGTNLELIFEAGGRRQTVQATIEGNVARGTFTDPQVTGQGRATLEVKDADHVRLTLAAKNAYGGEQTIPFEFTREAPATASAGHTAGTATSSAERDPALVGAWRKTTSYTSGPEFGMVSDTFMTLRADGTFRHGDTNMAGGGSAGSVSSRGGDAVEGQWRSQGQQLYVRTAPSDPWEHAARYYIEGNKLLATLPGGEKELWTRIR